MGGVSVSEGAVSTIAKACDALSGHLDKISADVDKIASASTSGFGASPDGKKIEQKLHEYATSGCNADGLKSSAAEQKKTVQSYKDQLQKGFKQIQEQDQLAAKGINGTEAGGSGGEKLGAIGKGGKAGNTAAQAEQFLGQSADKLKRAGLGMDPNVPNDVCCANFVSAMLQREGLIDFHTNGVADLSSRLQSQGWHTLTSGEPPVGAVVIVGGGQHTEIYAGGGRWIGSNNTNGGTGPQVVSYEHPWGSYVYLVPPGY